MHASVQKVFYEAVNGTAEWDFHWTVEYCNMVRWCSAGHVCSTTAGFDTVEMKDQQIQTETVEPVKPHVQAENTTEPEGVYTTVHVNDNINNKGTFMLNVEATKFYMTIWLTAVGSDKVEVKDQPAKVETVDQQVLAGDTVQQQGVVL